MITLRGELQSGRCWSRPLSRQTRIIPYRVVSLPSPEKCRYRRVVVQEERNSVFVSGQEVIQDTPATHLNHHPQPRTA